MELKKRHYLLKKILDELEIVPDWTHIRTYYVKLALEDMASKEIINFGYERGRELPIIPDKLVNDLKLIQNNSEDSFFEGDLNPKTMEKIEDYKKSDSFEKIWADYYQPELLESMLFEKN